MSIGGYTFLFDVDESPKKNVFFDPTERRKSRVKTLLRTGLVAVFLWCVFFFSGTVSLSAVAEEIAFLWRSNVPWSDRAAPDAGPSAEGVTSLAELAHLHETELGPTLAEHHRNTAAPACTPRPAPLMAALARDGSGRRVFGHMPAARNNAGLSLPRSCDTLDVLMPEWLTLTSGGGALQVETAPDDVRMDAEDFRARTGPALSLLPVVRLDTGAPGAATLLTDPQVSARALDDLVGAVRALDAAGACLDFDQLTGAALEAAAPFYAQFRQRFQGAGLQTCVVLPGDGAAWTSAAFTEGFDRVVLKLFRSAWIGSVPGPAADEAWFETTVARARDVIGTERLVVALGNFVTDWQSGKPLPERLSYAEFSQQAVAADARLRFSEAAGNGFAAYTGADGARHRAWVLDAVSAHNQLHILADLGVTNVAIWSLGTEDPSLWPLLSSDIRNPSEVIDALSEVRLPTHVDYTGEGAFLRVLAQPTTGTRRFDFSQTTGRIAEASYDTLPTPYLLERYGKPEGKELVLTFDDGPDPAYTADILDILTEADAPGAFFVVGAQVMQHPDLLVRMVDDGHEIGTHTFTHPRMDEISRTRAELEHSMSHKLIAGHSGRETRLYREPFQRAGGPVEAARVTSLVEVQAKGEIIAGMDVVPPDWLGLTADEIVTFVIDEVEKGTGNVLLFHDGGGDRSETVKALPVLISELRARGYEFTTLAALLGTTRAELMPEAEALWPGLDKVSFDVLSGTWDGLVLLFWVVLGLGLTRSVIVLGLVLVARFRRIPPVHSHERPKVAFVVPAFNEENAVANCIHTLLKTTYENFEIIVVDDGSTDDTFEEVQKLSTDRRIRLFAQFNHGKWGALNTAIHNTDAEILVCIDADTQVRPDALDHLVRHFANPRIGAVAGKVVVGNRVNLLTRLQALEYITAQNFERRAHDMLNSMLVVPGALGAWRTDALKAAGMYSSDTVTEDADMTVSVARAGYRITYEDDAVAYTEAPETVKILLSQRLRWSFGMFQTAWKHRGAIRQRVPVGLISIPDLVIFGYLFALIAPIADMFLLVLAWNQVFGDPAQLAFGGGLVGLGPVAFAYLALPLFEMFVAGYALKTDKRESLWMLLLFPFQRFFYRQLLYYSVLRALVRAVMGSFTGWGIKKRMRRDMLALQDG